MVTAHTGTRLHVHQRPSVQLPVCPHEATCGPWHTRACQTANSLMQLPSAALFCLPLAHKRTRLYVSAWNALLPYSTGPCRTVCRTLSSGATCTRYSCGYDISGTSRSSLYALPYRTSLTGENTGTRQKPVKTRVGSGLAAGRGTASHTVGDGSEREGLAGYGMPTLFYTTQVTVPSDALFSAWRWRPYPALVVTRRLPCPAPHMQRAHGHLSLDDNDATTRRATPCFPLGAFLSIMPCLHHHPAPTESTHAPIVHMGTSRALKMNMVSSSWMCPACWKRVSSETMASTWGGGDKSRYGGGEGSYIRSE